MTRLLAAVALISVALLVLAGALVLVSTDARPDDIRLMTGKGGRVSWSPDHILVTMAPGETKTVQATVTSSGAVPATQAWVAPALAPYLTVSPIALPALGDGSERTVNLSLTVPGDAAAEEIEGSVHLRSGSSTIARPLLVTLRILRDAECTVPASCDDGNPCTADLCEELRCVHPFSASGASCESMNGTDCSDPDTCDGLGHCQPNHRPAGALCADDQNACTGDVCNDAGECTHPSSTVPCSDGDACTLDDACSNGSCVPGSPRNCDDGDPCTVDSCDPATGCLPPVPDPACSVCAGAAFCDTFSRPDSTSAGNGWSEDELAATDARVLGSRLNFPGVDAAVAYRAHEGGAGGSDITMTWVYRKGSESVNLNEVDGVSAQYDGGRGIGGLFLAWIPRPSGQVSIGDGQVLSTVPHSFATDTDYNFQWDIYPDYSMNVWIWRVADPKPPAPVMTMAAFTPAPHSAYWAIGNRLGAYFDDFRVETPARPSELHADISIDPVATSPAIVLRRESAVGATVTVDVKLRSASPITYDAISLEILFDRTLVQVTAVDGSSTPFGPCNAGGCGGPICADSFANGIANATGDLLIAVTQIGICPDATTTGEVTLMRLKFTATTAGSSTLRFGPSSGFNCGVTNNFVDQGVPCVDGNATISAHY